MNINKKIEEAYLKMIAEQPVILPQMTKQHIAVGANLTKTYIENNHSKSTKFGNYHHLKHPDGSDLYYRYDNGVKELSKISNNIQVGVDKGSDGDVEHIHNFMKHHINSSGSLQTDKANTEGSKKMWINFVKKNAQFKYSKHDIRNNSSEKVDSSNIDKLSDSIWNKNLENQHIYLKAEK